MLDLFDKLTEANYLVSILVAFIIGLSGSIHCLGMCGGLVFSITKTKTENFIYHLGRLTGYITLGVIFSYIGKQFITLFGDQITFYLMLIFSVGFSKNRSMHHETSIKLCCCLCSIYASHFRILVF